MSNFEQQYLLTKSLSDIEGVVKAISLERFQVWLSRRFAAHCCCFCAAQNTLLMMFEDSGGESVREWLSGSPYLVERVAVAAKIARALGQIHQRGVVHKDINPANVRCVFITTSLALISASSRCELCKTGDI